jgi:glycerol-3-phosphate cytidylyltransferase-like family protein
MADVVISGIFDPLHAGHLAYIHAAQRIGTVEAVVSDDLEKHPPLVPLAERKTILNALGCQTSGTNDLSSVIRRARPRILLKGREWQDRLPADVVAACQHVGTAIEYCDLRLQSSSSLLLQYERRRNAAMLVDFERFAQEQSPPTGPWQPVTDYSQDTRYAVEAPQADILAACFQGLSVLDYGCGFGYLGQLLRARGLRVHDYDPQRWPDSRPQAADVVICREVLEHLPLREVRRTITELVGLARRYVYVTTRFSQKSHLLGVDGADDLDPTHITLLHQDFLRALFVLEGAGRRRTDLEAALDWRQVGRVLVYEAAHD